MSYKVDFHIHSYYSDGTKGPVELVRDFHDDEYDMIAITDHDGIDGLKEALIAGEAVKIKVVTGVELSTQHNGLDIHLLGYYFDPDNEALNKKFAELKTIRRERNQRLLAQLNKLGVDISLEELERSSRTGYVGKPNIARLMVEKGYISQVSEAFEPGRFLEAPEVKAVRRKKMDTVEAIALIKEAGGIAAVAHPGKIKNLGSKDNGEFWNNMDALLRELKKAGLKGLECYHPDHTEDDVFELVKLAGKYHLHITEGSDYHGE